MAATSRKAFKLFKRSFSSKDSPKEDIKVFNYDVDELEVHKIVTAREEALSEFDILLRSSWEKAVQQGVTRYPLPKTELSVLPGQYGFMIQEIPGRYTDRRKPENIQKLKQSFDGGKFNFQKVSPKEILFEMREKSRGKEHNLVIVNVSPITYGHVLLVPSVKSGLPQVFTENSLRLAIETVALSNHRGFCLFANSLLSYASVNHLHFHAMYFEYLLMAMSTGTNIFATPCLYLERYPCKGFMITIGTDVKKLAELCYQVVSLCYELEIPHNIVICYGKPQSQMRIIDSHGYVRFLLFPRKPVTGFKKLYESDKKPPVFCAACELGGCVVLLEKGRSSTFTEKELLDEMKANEISEEDYQVLVDRLKNDVFRIGHYY